MVGSLRYPSCRRRKILPCAYPPVAICNRPPQAQMGANGLRAFGPAKMRFRLKQSQASALDTRPELGGAAVTVKLCGACARPPLVGKRFIASLRSPAREGFPWPRGDLHHACTTHVPRMHLPIPSQAHGLYLPCTTHVPGFERLRPVILHSYFFLLPSPQCGFGVALGWLWGGFRVAMGCLSVG